MTKVDRSKLQGRRRRVLVTGGGGFIGSHLVEYLLAQGNEVICVDNFFTGNKENVAPYLANPYFELIRHDVAQPLYIEVDDIYHLACPASPIHYQYNPVQTVRTSVMGTINMLGLAKRTGARLLLASTSEVYGDPQVHPQREDYWGNVNPIGPRSCYDEGKRVAETLCMDYHRQNGVEVKIARIFNTYGPRMAEYDGRVVSNFIIQALKNEPITVYGDGSQTRSFGYVDDLVCGFVSLLEDTEPDFTGPVNLGNPNEITVHQLAETVIKLAGSSSQIVEKPLPKDDPTRRKPDITLAKEVLGWQPTTQLEKGLQATIDYFRPRVLGSKEMANIIALRPAS